jgi:hypothetical protein
VTEVGDGFFVADSATGPVTFFFGDDSTFLLRLRRGARSDVVPGAVVAVLGEPVGTARVEARSILVFPSESRPVIQGPDLFAFGGGGDGEAGGAARDGDGENSDAGSAEDAAAGDALVDDEMADAGTSDAASDDSQDLDAGDLGTTEGESESAELEMGPDTDDATGTGEPANRGKRRLTRKAATKRPPTPTTELRGTLPRRRKEGKYLRRVSPRATAFWRRRSISPGSLSRESKAGWVRLPSGCSWLWCPRGRTPG